MSIQYLVVEFKPTAVGTTRPGLPPKHNKVRLRLNLFMTLPPDFKGGEDFIKYETKRERERDRKVHFLVHEYQTTTGTTTD